MAAENRENRRIGTENPENTAGERPLYPREVGGTVGAENEGGDDRIAPADAVTIAAGSAVADDRPYAPLPDDGGKCADRLESA